MLKNANDFFFKYPIKNKIWLNTEYKMNLSINFFHELWKIVRAIKNVTWHENFVKAKTTMRREMEKQGYRRERL